MMQLAPPLAVGDSSRARLLFHTVGGGLGHLSRLTALADDIKAVSPTTQVLVTGETEYGPAIAPHIPFMPLPSRRDLVSGPWAQSSPQHSPLLDLVGFVGLDGHVRGRPGKEASACTLAFHAMLDALLVHFEPDVIVHDTIVWESLFDVAETIGSKQAVILRRRRDLGALAQDRANPVWRSDLLLLPYEPGEAEDILLALPPHAPRVAYLGRVGRGLSVEPDEVRRRIGAREASFVIVVTAGGGGFPDDRGFYETACDGIELAVNHIAADCTVVVVLGPRYADGLRLATNLDVQVWNSLPWMPDLIAAANLVICRGGYNTLTEVGAAGARAIVVPGERNIDDQEARAWEMRRRHHEKIHVLPAPSASRIAELVTMCLADTGGGAGSQRAAVPHARAETRLAGVAHILELAILGSCTTTVRGAPRRR
jgi:predicted glycosyltransferase